MHPSNLKLHPRNGRSLDQTSALLTRLSVRMAIVLGFFFSFLLVQNVYRVVHDGLPTHLGYECVKGSEFSLCSLAEYISVTVPDDLSAHTQTQWSSSES